MEGAENDGTVSQNISSVLEHERPSAASIITRNWNGAYQGRIHHSPYTDVGEDRRGCKYTPMTQEELAEPLTPRSPTTVSNSPDVGQPLWHPLLADSEHAYAWWMLSKEEMQTVLADLQNKAENRVTSRMTGNNPKQQVMIKKQQPATQPKGTTSQSGSGGNSTPAKSTSTSSPSKQGIEVKQELGISREPKGPPAPRLHHRLD